MTLMARSQCYETNVQRGKLVLSHLEKYQTQNYWLYKECQPEGRSFQVLLLELMGMF